MLLTLPLPLWSLEARREARGILQVCIIETTLTHSLAIPRYLITSFREAFNTCASISTMVELASNSALLNLNLYLDDIS